MQPASKSGNLDLFPDSVVYEVPVTAENRVTGVRYLHRVTRKQGEVKGRSVVVAAACVQSVALLQMSKSRLYPGGLGNSSGHLGKHFIPHFTGGVEAFLTDLIGTPVTNDEGFLDHAYLPSFMHERPRDYVRRLGPHRFGDGRRVQESSEGSISGFCRVFPLRGDDPESEKLY